MVWEKWRITVSGDAADGWIVDVHDGVHHGTYWTEAPDATAAQAAAEAAHTARYFPAAAPEPAIAPSAPAAPEPGVAA